jgi:hypothetical protein
VRTVAGGHHGTVEDPGDVGERLADAVEAALPGWVQRSVQRRLTEWSGTADPEAMAHAGEAGRRAAAEVGTELRRLLAADVDEQWTNPLSIVRRAVRRPTEVLRAAGVPPVVREPYDERHFPDDDYDLTPRAFADVDPALHELGLLWGVVKARAHLERHGHKPTAGER